MRKAFMPGFQVVGRARIDGQGPNLVLGRNHLRAQTGVNTSALSDLTGPPKPLEGPIVPSSRSEFRTVVDVIDGLGLDASSQRALGDKLREWSQAPNPLEFRRSMYGGLRAFAPDNFPLRNELGRRCMSYFKSTAGGRFSRAYGREGQSLEGRMVVQKAMPQAAPQQQRLSGGQSPEAQHRGAQIGEVRDWQGGKFRKVAPGQWEPVSGPAGAGKPKPPAGAPSAPGGEESPGAGTSDYHLAQQQHHIREALSAAREAQAAAPEQGGGEQVSEPTAQQLAGMSLDDLMKHALAQHGEEAVAAAAQKAIKGVSAKLDKTMQAGAAKAAKHPDIAAAGEKAAKGLDGSSSKEAVQAATEQAAKDPKLQKAAKAELAKMEGAVVDQLADGIAEAAPGKAPSKFRAVMRAIVKGGAGSFVFGFLDNFIMYCAGASIDGHLAAMGFGAAATAGVGNAISDGAGQAASNFVEKGLSKIGLGEEEAGGVLSEKAESRIKAAASIGGVFLGALAGMVPMLFGVSFGKSERELRDLIKAEQLGLFGRPAQPKPAAETPKPKPADEPVLVRQGKPDKPGEKIPPPPPEATKRPRQAMLDEHRARRAAKRAEVKAGPWGPVPNSKIPGAQRRWTGNGYDYRYPKPGGGYQRDPHVEPKKKEAPSDPEWLKRKGREARARMDAAKAPIEDIIRGKGDVITALEIHAKLQAFGTVPFYEVETVLRELVEAGRLVHDADYGWYEPKEVTRADEGAKTGVGDPRLLVPAGRGSGAAGRANEGAGAAAGHREAKAPSLTEAVKVAGPVQSPEVSPVPDGREHTTPDLDKSPAIKLHPDLLPKIDDEARLPDDVRRFPHPHGPIQQLFPHQAEAAERIRQAWIDGDGIILQDDAGLGKSQPVSARVPTPEGWRAIGTIKPGDMVFGSDGRPTEVEGVYPQGELRVCLVKFSDGSSTRASEDHLWTVYYWKSGRDLTPLTVTTAQLRDRPVIEHGDRTLDLSKARRLGLPMLGGPLKFGGGSDLPILPYALGQLISNGYLGGRSASLTVNSKDWPFIRERLSNGGIRLGAIDDKGSCTRVTLLGHHPAVRSLELDVPSGGKFIPGAYLIAGDHDRIALLQGLMDGDGSCSKRGNRLTYSTTSRRLAEDVRDLVEGLGGIASIRRYDRTDEGRSVEFSVRIRVPSSIAPFSVPRKAVRYRPGKHAVPRRSVAGVENVGFEACVCIKVAAEDSLYATEHGILTHNTNSALAAMVAHGGKRNLIVVPVAGKEGLKTQWMGETAAGLYGIEVKGAKVETTRTGKQRIVKRLDEIQPDAEGFFIVSYDELTETVTDPDTGKAVKRFRKNIFDGEWDTIAFDEAHTMMNPDAQVSKAGKALQERAEKVLYMSATPITNVADMHYLTKLGLFENDPQSFAKWADKAGAQVDGTTVKNPSSPLPMAAIAATLHVDGKSVKRTTSLEGVTSQFGVVTQEDLGEQHTKAFEVADKVIDAAEAFVSESILRALYIGWNRQYWEQVVTDRAIEIGKAERAAGKQVAFFTSYKSADHQHLRAIPRMLARRGEKMLDSESPGVRGQGRLLMMKADEIQRILTEMPPASSAVKRLVEAFGGPEAVAEIHGATSKKPANEQQAYQSGEKPVCVATMARGGTGISLHDTKGDAPRVQINLSLPWSGREFNQVAGRSHRLGSKSDTTMHWMFGEDEWQQHNAAVVAKRLKSMGSLTAGDPELTVDASALARFEWANNNVSSSDDAESLAAAMDEMQAAIDAGEDEGEEPKPDADSDLAAATRDYFREFAEQRAAGRDVLGERYKARMDRKAAQEFLDARRAAEQLRQAVGWDIKWRPGFGAFEIEAKGLSKGHEKHIRSKKVGGKGKTYGGRYTQTFWVEPEGMTKLVDSLQVHRTQVDMRKVLPEQFDPKHRDDHEKVVDELTKKHLRVKEVGRSEGDLPLYLVSGDTWDNKDKLGGLGRWDPNEGGYLIPGPYIARLAERLGIEVPAELLASSQAAVREIKQKREAAEGHLPKLSGSTDKGNRWAADIRRSALKQLEGKTQPEAVTLRAYIERETAAGWFLRNKDSLGWKGSPLRVGSTTITKSEDWDAQLDGLRQRMVLRLDPQPMSLIWVAEAGDDLGARAPVRTAPGWEHEGALSKADKAFPGIMTEAELLAKAKYIKREGTPGNYVYTYAKPDGSTVRVRQKHINPGSRGPYKKTRDKEGRTVYTGGAKPPGEGWESIPESTQGGMRRRSKEKTEEHGRWEYWYPQGEKQPGMFGEGSGPVPAAPKPKEEEAAAPAKPKGEQLGLFKGAGGSRLRQAVAAFLQENPEPEDHAIHGLAAALGVDKHEFEELIYAMLAEKLHKGATHRYIKRIPNKNPPPKFRYFYREPKRKGITESEDIQQGSKFKVEHGGQLGHFEVRSHDKASGMVTVRHDESGRTVNLTEKDLHRMIAGHHGRKTKRTVEERAAKHREKREAQALKLRVQPAQGRLPGTEAKPEFPEPKKEAPPAPKLPRATLNDLGKGGFDDIVGFSMDAGELEQQAAAMKTPDREYAIIPQAKGFVLASKAKAASKGKEAVGDATTIYLRGTGRNIQELKGEWAVVEADTLIASHDASGFTQRDDYPVGVQERPYHRDKSEQGKVDAIARDMLPAMVANSNPSAIDGAPIVTEQGVVLGGNGRTMGMQRAYELYPESADKLREHLQRHAKAFGLSAPQIAGMKNPVLVRRVKAEGKDEMTRLGRRMNEALTQGLDPRAAEVAVSKFVTQDVVDDLTHRMSPDQTLNGFLSTPASREFIQTLERAGIIDERNKNEFVNAGTGLLNEDGRERVSRVMAARLIPDSDLLDSMNQSWRENLAQAVPSFLQAESAGWDLRPHLVAAVQADADMQQRGLKRTAKDRKVYLAQLGLLDETKRAPEVRALLTVLQEHGGKSKGLPSGFRQVALEADRQKHDHGDQGSMFARPKVSVTEALASAFKLTDEELAASMSARAALGAFLGADELRKAEVGTEGLGRYLMHAVLWELDNLMRGELAAVAGGAQRIDGPRMLERLKRFIREQAKVDSNFARALGAHPLDDATLRGLCQAAAKSRMTEIVKSLARSALADTLAKSGQIQYVG